MNILKALFGEPAPSVSADETKLQLDAKKGPFLLDVRQDFEFRDAHIKGSTLIPLSQLSARMSELPKDRPIICVCRSGGRSGRAARDLVQAGYEAVNMRGGIGAWQRAGYPLKKGR